MESGAIFHLQDDQTLVELHEQPYESEDLLQSLLADNPSLLAGELMNRTSPRRWLLVKREAGVPDATAAGDRWSMDHLFLDQHGIPTIVEVKRSSDTRIRREIVGQMLDYAANAVAYWPTDRIRQMFEESCRSDGKDPESEVMRLLLLEIGDSAESAVDQFWQSVEKNFEAKELRLVFVSDMIPEELQRVVEFLNEQMNQVDVLAVEVKQYVGQGSRTLVPRVFGMTAEAQSRKRAAPPPATDEASFLLRFPEAYAASLRVFFNDLRQNGLRINWGVVGCSIRTAAHGRSSPLSIAWVNPPERAGWFGLKDVTVGIDRNSLELSSPHLLGNADSYAEEIALLPGGEPVSGQGMAASSFPPDEFIAHQRVITDALITFGKRLSEEA